MSSFAPGPVCCPSCTREVARHPWFVRKRVRELSCPHCGAQLEVAIPFWPHYLTAFVIAILGEIVALVSVFLLLGRMWFAVALVVAIVAAIELARGAWLRRGAEVRWINQGSMERQAAGRWRPE